MHSFLYCRSCPDFDPSLFSADYECFQIELSKNYGMPEWREDIKKIMLKAGLQSLPITFLFTDTQVLKGSSFLHALFT